MRQKYRKELCSSMYSTFKLISSEHLTLLLALRVFKITISGLSLLLNYICNWNSQPLMEIEKINKVALFELYAKLMLASWNPTIKID